MSLNKAKRKLRKARRSKPTEKVTKPDAAYRTAAEK